VALGYASLLAYVLIHLWKHSELDPFVFVCLFMIKSCYVAQAGFELTILLPQFPELLGL
jgi:hypothetical protein